MPRERLPMRKISDVLRLHAGGLSKRRIAVSLNIGRAAVGDYINRARRAGLGWPLAEDLSDEDLERLLFPPPVAVSPDRRSLPDWPVLHRELKRPGVTRSLLWEEYRAVHRDGYGYSRFCELYRAWKGGLAPTMRQSHVAGEKMFVDYAGATLEVIDGLTGEVRAAQIFVANRRMSRPRIPGSREVTRDPSQARKGGYQGRSGERPIISRTWRSLFNSSLRAPSRTSVCGPSRFHQRADRQYRGERH